MSITEDFISLSTEQKMKVMDEIMDEVRAELDATAKPGINLYDDSDEADEEIYRRFREGVSLMLKKKKERGLPIARYDSVKKRSYIEYNNQKYSVEEFNNMSQLDQNGKKYKTSAEVVLLSLEDEE